MIYVSQIIILYPSHSALCQLHIQNWKENKKKTDATIWMMRPFWGWTSNDGSRAMRIYLIQQNHTLKNG